VNLESIQHCDGRKKRIISLETKEEFSIIRFSSSVPILPPALLFLTIFFSAHVLKCPRIKM
jgi:hypothetical protein